MKYIYSLSGYVSHSKNMSFITTLVETSTERSKVVDEERAEKQKRFEEARDKRLDDMMVKLTEKYHHLLKKGLEQAAHGGRREKYMNFERDDFKANFPTLGTPADMASRWLCEVVTEDSKYLPFKEGSDDKEREHFKGLQFDVWNNGAFTIHFTW